MPRTASEERLEKILISLFGFMVLSIINLLNAWFVMLAAGVAHGYWPQIPAFGYWATYLLIVGVSAIAGGINGGMKVDISPK